MSAHPHDVAGRRPRNGIELLEDLLPRLDRLVSEMARDRENMTDTLAALRGSSNHMLWSGTIQLTTALLSWSQDFVVPFASVLVADTLGAGPLTISTGAAGEAMGPGTLQLPLNGYANAPLTGRHLSIIGAVANKPVFVAIFTKVQTPTFGLL